MRDAFVDADGDITPDRLGKTVTLRGVLISNTLPAGGTSVRVNFQDRSGGTLLFTRNPDLLRGVQRGDVVQATGEVAVYNGNRELMLSALRRIGPGVVPAPTDVLVADLLGPRRNGELVRVAGELTLDRDFLLRKSSGVRLRDRTGEIPVLISDRFFTSHEFLDRFQLGGQVQLVGIASQSKESPPYDSGYRLVPRDADDFAFARIPPYREIAVAAGFAVLAAAVWLTVRRRRAAERRAEAMRRLLERVTHAEDERNRFFNLSLDLLCIAHADGHFKRVNPAFTRTLGWSADELLARPFLDFVHPDDRAATLREVERQVVAGEEILNFENRYQHKDGAWHVLAWTSVPQPGGFMFATARDVTPLRQAEAQLLALHADLERRVLERTQALRESEERFRIMVESVTDYAIFMLSPEGRVLNWNRGAQHLYGHQAAEIVGQHFSRLYPKEDRAGGKAEHDLAAASAHRRFAGEGCRERADGTRFIAQTSMHAMHDEAGGLRGFVKITHDITARRQAEDALRQQARILDQSFDAVLVWEWDGPITYWNSGAERLYGFARTEAVGRISHELLHTAQPDGNLDLVRFLETHGHFHREIVHTKKNGQRVLVETWMRLIRDGDRRFVIETNRDITERKRVEEVLRQSEAYYRTLIDAASDGILVMDKRGRYTDINAAGCTMLGYSREELPKLRNSALMAPEEVARLSQELARLAAGKAVKSEWHILRKDGSTFFGEINATLLPDGRRLGVLRDITERKQAMEALRQREQEQRDLNRLLEIERARLDEAQAVAKIGSWELELPGSTVTWSKETYRIFETDPRQFLPTRSSFAAFIHPNDRAKVAEAIEASLSALNRNNVEYRILLPGGRIKFIEENWRVYHDHDGQTTRLAGTCQDITERRHAEEALRAYQRQFEILFRSSPIAIGFGTAREGWIVDVNHQCSQLFGYAPEEMAGHRVFDLNVWPDFEAGQRALQTVMQVGRADNVEARLRHKSGKEFDALVSLARLTLDEEEMIVAMFVDVTERNQAQRELASRIRQQAALAALSARALANASPQTLADEAAAVVASVLEVEFSDVIELRPDKSGGRLVAAVDLRMDPKGQSNGADRRDILVHFPWHEAALVNADEPTDGPRWTLAVPAALHDQGIVAGLTMLIGERHHPWGVMGAYSTTERTFTEDEVTFVESAAHIMGTALSRARAEQALRESEEKFSLAFRNIPDAVLVTTMEGRILNANAGFTRLTGYAIDEALGRTTAELGCWEDLAARERYFTELQKHGHVMNVHARFRTRTGELRAGLVSGERIVLGGRPAMVGVVRDVTELNAAEEAIRRSEQDLRLFATATNDALWNWDCATGRVDRSVGFAKHFGYAPGAIVPVVQWWIDRIHPDDRAQVMATAQQAMDARAETVTYRYRFRRADDSYATIEDRVCIVRDESGKVERAMGAVTDITRELEQQAAIRRIARQLLVAEEAERRRIAKELHDSTVQGLVAAMMNLEFLRDRQSGRTAAESSQIEDSLALLENSAHEIRTLSYLLHPPRLDETGLEGAIRHYVAGYGERTGLAINADLTPDLGRLGETEELILFRVVQESLGNIHRHAQSKTATVRLRRSAGEVVLEISDQGRGIPPPVLAAQPGASPGLGVGIPGMRERLRQIEGRLEIESGAGGTTIRAVLPLKKDQSWRT